MAKKFTADDAANSQAGFVREIYFKLCRPLAQMLLDEMTRIECEGPHIFYHFKDGSVLVFDGDDGIGITK